MKLALALAVLALGCNSNDKQIDAAVVHDSAHIVDSAHADARPIDAPAGDAAMATVLDITCPSGTLPTIATVDGTTAYIPSSVTITQNGIVKFTMASSHNVAPNTTGSDPGLSVGLGVTKCLQFTATGTFGFHCVPHTFMGSVIVN
jgi:plastocyanin